MDDVRKNPHESIDELVKEYQQGNAMAGEELLRIFGCHPNEEVGKYIGKYYDLLRYGKMDFSNRDLRRFVSLYVEDKETRQRLVPFYQYGETRAETMKTVQMLEVRFEVIDDEDLLQDLRLLLLQQAKRYEKKGNKINFCGYLYNSYRYALYHYYKWLFEDLGVSSYTSLDEAIDQQQDDETEIEIEDSWFFKDKYFEKEENELGFNWIHNRTTTFPFNKLSVYERTILSLYYEQKLTDKEIAERTGLHHITIHGHRNRIKDKLEDLLASGDANGY